MDTDTKPIKDMYVDVGICLFFIPRLFLHTFLVSTNHVKVTGFTWSWS